MESTEEDKREWVGRKKIKCSFFTGTPPWNKRSHLDPGKRLERYQSEIRKETSISAIRITHSLSCNEGTWKRGNRYWNSKHYYSSFLHLSTPFLSVMNAKVITRFFAPQNEFPQAHVVYSEENKLLNSAQFPFLKRGEKGREQDMNSRRHLHMWEGKGGRKGTLHHNGRKTKGRKRYFPFGPQSQKNIFFPIWSQHCPLSLACFFFLKK